MKKILKILTILLVINLFLTFNVKANYTNTVYVCGNSIGIKMDTGVYVAGKYAVMTENGKILPWKNSNIEVGDRILSVNNNKINNNKDLLNIIEKTNNSYVNLTINRNENLINTSVNIIKNQKNESSIGLYIKDQIQGIGTLTFVTKNKYFASLGHGVYDNKTLINSSGGSLFYSNVNTIKKAEPGNAGEKRAAISPSEIGKILSNDVTGLYGKMSFIPSEAKEVQVIEQKEIKKGKAEIYTVISSNIIKSYEIEITNINYQSSKGTKGVQIKVIDNDLIKETGGIVQGMSGSPIIQNGKLVGAVSHVTVDNPIYGYGMHVEWMLDEINEIVN